MGKEKEIKVEIINLTLGKKQLSLSVEEARKLMSVLIELFNERPAQVTITPYPFNYPYYVYYPRPFWTADKVEITCTSLNANVDTAYQAMLDYQQMEPTK